jgi:hypothetical protein
MDSGNLRTWLVGSLLLSGALVAAGFGLRDSVDPAQVQSGLSWVRAGGFIYAALVLAVWLGRRRLLAVLSPGEADRAAEERALARNPYATLFIASFVALFIEVMLIRYAGSQIRIFSFYKNVPLVAAYLGLGLGCWLGAGRARHALAFMIWLLPLAVFLSVGSLASHDWLSSTAAGASSEHILGDAVKQPSPASVVASQAFMAAFCVATLVAIALLFTLLGRLLGDAFDRVPRLSGYTTNILGSLAGILAFGVLSYLETPPWVWFAIGLLALLWWLRRTQEQALGLALIALLTLAVVPEFGDTVWSRYQKLVGHRIPPGPDGTGSSSHGYRVEISDVFYQVALDLRPEALEEMGGNPFPHYDGAMTILPPDASVLIVGAGTGNDVAAALRAGASHVTAVDIDPAIVAMGRAHHPEAPYDDRRVEVLIADARSAFHSLPRESYDAVVFGLLDSHTQLGMSSVRLDNYVFTLESLETVRGLLRPGGHIVLTAATFREWFRDRFVAMMDASCDSGVLVTGYGAWISYACRVDAPAEPAPGPGPEHADVVLPTDDWPFLYLPTRGIPAAYLIVVGLLVLASLAVLYAKGLRFEHWNASVAHLFFLGAAFLLMEVHAVNRLALLFGTTWLVSAVTIALVLILVVAANLTVSLLGQHAYKAGYPLLFASLGMSFVIEPGSVVGAGTAASIGFGLLLLSPVYFAGIIFARSFTLSAVAGPAIAANMFGSAVGGWVEYLSMAVGFRALVPLALCFYLASLIAHLRAQETKADVSQTQKSIHDPSLGRDLELA